MRYLAGHASAFVDFYIIFKCFNCFTVQHIYCIQTTVKNWCLIDDLVDIHCTGCLRSVGILEDQWLVVRSPAPPFCGPRG